MSNKWIIAVIILLIIALGAVFLVRREEPRRFVTDIWQQENNSDWGNVKVLHVQAQSGYTVVKIQYESKSGFQPPTRWIIKDRSKVKDKGEGFEQWEGYIYLVKKGISTWKAVQ
ncbi:hypothetical protein [Paenibacillus kobensis]|uniref:hypothetical protein n=1 Tax=Paenibacillus kobensis TaxID=59841 RepID=UPI000FDB5221|nr:hypothetical protein [Paenibacillus kobensis]